MPARTPKLLLLGVLGLLATAATMIACGGSASESPWPVEPDTPTLGPEGEDAPPPSNAIPDAGADATLKAPNVEP